MASLSDSQDAFLHLLDISSFGTILVDTDLRIVKVSQGGRRAFRNVTSLLGRELGDVLGCIWPEPLARDTVAHLRHTLESGESYRSPLTVVSRVDTGDVECYDWEIERLTLADGRPGVLCQFYDLTQKHRLVKALRRIKDRFRLALDAAGAFVFELDLAAGGEVIAYGMERVTGYRPGEDHHTVAWWYSLIHPEDLPGQLKRNALHLEKGGTGTSVYRIRHRDGAWIWVESTAQVLKDASGRPTKVVGAMVDITQRKEAGDALRESERRLRELHALSTRLLGAHELNRTLDDLLGSAIEACDAHFGSVQLFNSQLRGLEIVAQRGFRQPFLEHFQVVGLGFGSVSAQVLQHGEQIMIEDLQLDTEFAQNRYMAEQAGYRALISMPLKTHDGRVLGVLSTHFRHPHSASMQELQLLELYARYAADLVVRLRYEQALRESERRKDEFIATLAHELRGPLAPLANSLEVLKRAGGDDRVEKARAIMDRQVSHLSRLVDDMLDISRIAHHKLELRMENVELGSVMLHVVETCRPLLENSAHRLELDMPAEPIRVRADPVRLAQIFVNLVSNACKYMDRGGRISVRARPIGSEAEITVSDTGFGIAPDLLPWIFELFMQVESVSHKSAGGLGIGLALVKRLVDLHGGTVTAHSEGIGHGSNFIVRLPLMNGSAGPGASATGA